MSPFLTVVDQSKERCERDLAAIRANPHSAKDEAPVVVVHTESQDAHRAIKECLAVNGISFQTEVLGERVSFEVAPFMYQDARKAIIANLPQLRERSAWRDYVYYFPVRDRRSA